jgi:DNA repair photolyase
MFTKHKIPEKTMRLMKKYSYLIIPTISLARLDNELNFYIEPGGASVSDRIYTIKKLADYGLKVKARLNPVFPGVDDKQELLEEIIETYAKAGVYTVKAAYAVMRDSRLTQWMIKKVKDHPVLSQSWKQMTETIKIYLGKGNVPPLETRIKFYSNVNQMCRKHGLKFGICSTLDYPILSEKLKGIPVCKSIMTYYHGYIKPEGWAQ